MSIEIKKYIIYNIIDNGIMSFLYEGDEMGNYKAKTSAKLTAILTAVIIMITSVIPASAFCTSALLNDGISGSNWMRSIKDDTLLSDISIPGTHDSGSNRVSSVESIARCQNTTIAQQLAYGVRYLDMRLEYDANVTGGIKVVHSTVDCLNDNGSGVLALDTVFNTCFDFLKNNPSETIIMSVKEDDGSNISQLVSLLNNKVLFNSNYFYTGNSNTPALGSTRGKIVFAKRISELSYGLNLSWGDQGSDGGSVDQPGKNLEAQDRYNMGISAKWNNAVKPMLDKTKPAGKWFINFLSTTHGQLIPNPLQHASEMNANFTGYEMKNNKCYGIVVFDGVNENLARRVYQCNDLVAKDQPDSESGQYYYRINFNTTDNVPSGWSGVSLRLYYKENNGTGTERSILIFENGEATDGYQFVCSTGNYDFSGYINGFPTKLVFYCSWDKGSDQLAINQRLYVSAKPSDNMTLCCKNDFVSASATKTESYITDASIYPYANTIEFTNSGNMTIQAPQIGSPAVNSYPNECKIYDQYGVKWYSAPTSYTLSATYSSISLSGNTINITQKANDLPNNTSFYLYAQYNDSKSHISTPGKQITINTNKINYAFVNDDGTVLETGSDYAGKIPVYTGVTPTKTPNENYHYTFNGWSSNAALSSENNTYTATYNQNQHLVNRTVVSVKPTCTQDGYNTNYCSCGYAWTVSTPATGHTLVTESKEPTCTQDGYNRLCCKICGHIESQEILKATGHNYDSVYCGEHVNADENGNGYTPYFCSVCNEEIVDLRVYDSTDWSSYYDALNVIDGIKNDPDYSSYNQEFIDALEQTVAKVQAIENEDQSSILQVRIDGAVKELTDAIDAFSAGTGVEYYTLTFIFNDGTTKKLTYKSGTPVENIDIPDNTKVLTTQSMHTIYKWPTIKDVTKNAVYKESSATSMHTFNTFIYPSETIPATCTEDGYIKHTCLCGYVYNEKIADATGHNYGEWKSNADGTHSRVCSNDSNHIETENCIINLATHKCIICDYALDLSAYNAIVITAQSEMQMTDKYTEESLQNLRDVYIAAQSSLTEADTQAKVDAIVFDLQTAISMLELRQYNLSFYYITDDDNSKVVSSYTKAYRYGDTVELQLPSDAYSNNTIEKWTVEDLQNGITNNLHTTSAGVTAVIEKDVEYIAYISTDKNEVSDTTSMITVLDKDGKISDVIYLKNGVYDVTINENKITLKDNSNNAYTLHARNYVFYNIASFTIGNETLSDNMNIQSNMIITPIYSV